MGFGYVPEGNNYEGGAGAGARGTLPPLHIIKQRVMLKATYSEEDKCWYLNGVKRFITNGDSDIHLVLARSEEGTHDARGLSMFIYDNSEHKATRIAIISHKSAPQQ